VLIGALNVGIAFLCAMALALRAREIPARIRRVVFRAVLRRFAASPWTFFFPEKTVNAAERPVPSESEVEEER